MLAHARRKGSALREPKQQGGEQMPSTKGLMPHSATAFWTPRALAEIQLPASQACREEQRQQVSRGHPEGFKPPLRQVDLPRHGHGLDAVTSSSQRLSCRRRPYTDRRCFYGASKWPLHKDFGGFLGFKFWLALVVVGMLLPQICPED